MHVSTLVPRCSFCLVRDADSFPGPASSAPIAKIKEYVEKRAAVADEAEAHTMGAWEEGNKLLWAIAGLALQFKVRSRVVSGMSSGT